MHVTLFILHLHVHVLLADFNSLKKILKYNMTGGPLGSLPSVLVGPGVENH